MAKSFPFSAFSPSKRSDNDCGTVLPLRFLGNDPALAAALKAGRPGAMEAFYDRYSSYVQRLLVRIVHVDMDIAELLQEVFIEAFTSVRSLKDENRLKAWLTVVTVFTARKHIKQRFRRISLCRPDPEADLCVAGADTEAREALRQVFDVLGQMPADERIPFSLRFMEEMELTEVAEACGVSLATVKRRLRKAQGRFAAAALTHPLLREWMARGKRFEVQG